MRQDGGLINLNLEGDSSKYRDLSVHFSKGNPTSKGAGVAQSLDDRGSILFRGWNFFSSLPHPDRFWGLPIFISGGYRG